MSFGNARIRIVTAGLVLLIALPGGAFAQTRIKQGFNLFSVDQDQEVGRQSAAEVEQQLPILHDQAIETYVNTVGKRLAAVAPGAKYPYQFKVVNVSDINAFALPGGFLYLNRGLIEAARSEGQLAAVMAHEISHVALRHGTSQTSKAYLGQAGLGILGGLLGKGDQSASGRIASVGGFGLNALFLKFSRTDEEQADVTGAQIMAKAGYDPADMVSFFQILADKSSREPSKVEQFFSSHPPPANRAARINQERAMLAINTTRPVGGFTQVRTRLARMSPAATMDQVAKGLAPTPQPAPRSGDRPVAAVQVDRPSSQLRTFEQRSRLFQIAYPENWRVYQAAQGYAVTIAPEGGLVDNGGAEPDLVYGVIVNHYDPFGNDEADARFGDRIGTSADRPGLAAATNDLVRQIRRTNPSLSLVPNSERRDMIDGAPSLSVVLTGRSTVTREEERVTVFTRELPDDHVLYALFIAPGRDYVELKDTFNRMISSLRVNDDATHGTSAVPASSGGLDSGRGNSVSRLTVPSGTVLAVALDQTLSTAESQPGDRFTTRVIEPVLVDGRVAIPAGSIVSGRVVQVVPSKKIGGRAQMNLEFTTLRVGSGSEGPISASFHNEGSSQTKQDATAIGGGALAGALLGRLIGKDTKSTVIGALVGGAIGTGVAARSEGEEVTLPEGMALQIQLNSPFEVR